MTFPEPRYADLEMSFARWVHSNSGWVHTETIRASDSYGQVAARWLDVDLIRITTKDRTKVAELTTAGYAWCRENGIGS